jgi:hypothetical protein
MKKILVLISIFTFFCGTAFSQWEFQYFVLKVGVNHHMLSPQPDTLNNYYLSTPVGEMRLFPSETYMDYVPGINADLHFHLDFQNDKGGVVAGLQYFNYAISAKYENFNQQYFLYSTYRVNGVGIPLLVKFGNDIFNDQRYFFFGVQYNLNIALQTVETTNWLTESTVVWAKDNQVIKSQPVFCFGFNYLVFNFELDYMPKNFLNPEYLKNVSSSDNPVYIKPYSFQPNNLFYFKTSLNIPLSPWTTKKNYTLHKIIKRLKFWR